MCKQLNASAAEATACIALLNTSWQIKHQAQMSLKVILLTLHQDMHVVKLTRVLTVCPCFCQRASMHRIICVRSVLPILR